ncbi:MAG TPA: histidine--tRNA ligase [Longimicrobiales bacterium]|nr:histidine--tRNA ligase [Longimicrobiales bacterium]
MATSAFARLPGFRDFPPEDLALRSHIMEAWRRVARRYGFVEYDGPPLEPLELYVEKSGGEIVEQLYAFTDKGDRQVALRPEMTPSLARILGDRSRGMSKPIRWFSMPQLFRYERQQRGRLREHFQWNVDIVGEEGVAADAEVLAVAIDGLRELGLGADAFRARVSDRRIVSAVLTAEGVAAERVSAALVVIDKLERQPRERSAAGLVSHAGMEPAAADRVIELFDDSEPRVLRERFGGHEEVAGHLERLDAYVGSLRAMGLGDFVEIDLRIVRGLAYYTGIVFELFDRKHDLRAICGGGRYDRLLELVGGEPLPAVGFGMGDVVLGELLAEEGALPEYRKSLDYFIVTVSEAQRGEALRIAHALRETGKSVAYALKEQGVAKQLKAAGREGAREALIVGPDELARGCVVAREMDSGSEREVSLAELA